MGDEFESDHAPAVNLQANPRFSIPATAFLGIEHPFRVRNADKAIESLGGQRRVAKLVEAQNANNYETQMFLQPGRKHGNSLVSSNTAASAVVIRAMVPKIIGRKRKRPGSANPIDGVLRHGLSDQQKLTQCLKDKPSACNLEVMGRLNRVHKFRTMADFAYSHENNEFMQRFVRGVSSFDYETLEQFQFMENDKEQQPNEDLIPPPLFSPHSIPFNYAYQQNSAVKVVVGADGQVSTYNEGKSRTSIIPKVPMDVKEVPTKPPDEAMPLESQSEDLQKLVQDMKALFVERPIWSRRAVQYQFRDHESFSNIKWLFQYVGYEFATGPWAMTVIRYGVDPRSDPKYRMFQSVTLHFEPDAGPDHRRRKKGMRGGNRVGAKKTQRADENGVPGYVFTGRSLVLEDGKTWQICDFQDPLLCIIANCKELRSECEANNDGWFKNGTWAKLKVIFRYKARALLYGDTSWTDADFAQASELPEEFDATQRDLPVDYSSWTKRAVLVAFHIKHGILSFSRPRNTWATSEVSEMIRQALQKNDEAQGERERGAADSSIEELLDGDDDVLNDGNGSDDDDEDEDENDENEDEDAGDDQD